MSPHRPKRSLGQNFLVDRNVQRRIVEALGAGVDDEVLEIGPGRGALTAHLVERGVRLTAVELDDTLAERLKEQETDRFHVLHGDVLAVDLESLFDVWSETWVLGNIPYNITSPILFRLLEPPRPREIVLLVQAEVADRLVAPPGTKTYGALSVGVRAVAEVSRLFAVSRTVFRPVPGVDSALVRITPHRPPSVADELLPELRRLTRATFGWRRKQLGTTLSKHPDYQIPRDRLEELLDPLRLVPSVRPERLSPEQFVALAETLASLR